MKLIARLLCTAMGGSKRVFIHSEYRNPKGFSKHRQFSSYHNEPEEKTKRRYLQIRSLHITERSFTTQFSRESGTFTHYTTVTSTSSQLLSAPIGARQQPRQRLHCSAWKPDRNGGEIRNTKRPCLAFKILAAGRLSWRRELVERAFRQAFQSIKPSDAVIVGIYNEFSDEPPENADLVRRYGA